MRKKCAEKLSLKNQLYQMKQRKILVTKMYYQEHAQLLDSSALVKPPAPRAESIQNNVLPLKQDALKTSINQDLDVVGFCASSEN